MSHFIQLKQVSKGYNIEERRFNALQSIDLQIDQGEYVAIVGKSGSGKTTLLNMLSGIDHPDHGNVEINGIKVHTLDESNLALWRGKNIGIVFQFFQLIPTLSIVENILLAMEFVNVIPRHQRQQRAQDLLEQVGIAEHLHKLPAALSGGEQQRAAIARALANNPPILIADEPTGNLDSHTAEIILGLFKSLVEMGKTVIVVTHDWTLVNEYPRVVTLKDGAVVNDQFV